MKSSDLMLGNITEQGIVIELKQNVCRVEYFTTHKRTSLISYEDLEPVRLTKEILFNAGGMLFPYTNTIEFSRFRFVWKKEYNYWYVTDSVSKEYMTKISYVHEFQNFIKVMNNQEVIIRL